MEADGYTLFDTALGHCAIAWGEHGVVATALPGSDDAATRRRMLRATSGAEETTPPDDVRAAIAAIAALLDGADDDLGSIALDMGDLPEFNRRVYVAARAIAPGTTVTYGELAEMIGERGAAQAVGQALGSNRFPIVVPCHRVVAADGSLRGFSAPGGIATKRRMLALEGTTPPALFD
jgi:methylated-DNA-[protein]-cysteine S-methyltransferase